MDLRRKNSLETTEAAVQKDLAKARWKLKPQARYRKAGRSPLFISGKYFSSAGRDPVTGEREGEVSTVASVPVRRGHSSKSKIDELTFFKFLYEKGFDVSHNTNSLTGKTEESLPEQLAELDFQFSAVPTNTDGIHVIQTEPQIQVAMSFEKFLELVKLKPSLPDPFGSEWICVMRLLIRLDCC